MRQRDRERERERERGSSLGERRGGRGNIGHKMGIYVKGLRWEEEGLHVKRELNRSRGRK